ncbi:helix-turn-helix transcriptional regulator [Ornithinimicrobium sp. W1665]|uniref:helix-turn-helix transcriptional regulator n=1 Tax=Ornithinimicrobium sp. W1665 TaxID=3416666 RepID=UPI003CF49FFB
MDTDEQIGRNVRALREAQGLSQAEVAAHMSRHHAGFYPQTITKIEAGRRSLKFVEGLRLASLLRVSPQELFKPSGHAVGDVRATGLMMKAREGYDALRRGFDFWLQSREKLQAALGGERDLVSESVAEEALAVLEQTQIPIDVEIGLAGVFEPPLDQAKIEAAQKDDARRLAAMSSVRVEIAQQEAQIRAERWERRRRESGQGEDVSGHIKHVVESGQAEVVDDRSEGSKGGGRMVWSAEGTGLSAEDKRRAEDLAREPTAKAKSKKGE